MKILKNKNIQRFKLFILFLILFCNKISQQNQDKVLEYQVKIEFKADQVHQSYIKKYQKTQSIFEIMQNLKDQNQVDFNYTGKDDMIFINEILGLKNEGSGKNKKNWLYFINNQLAEKGVSQILINKNTFILWCYTTWEKKDQCTN